MAQIIRHENVIREALLHVVDRLTDDQKYIVRGLADSMWANDGDYCRPQAHIQGRGFFITSKNDFRYLTRVPTKAPWNHTLHPTSPDLTIHPMMEIVDDVASLEDHNMRHASRCGVKPRVMIAKYHRIHSARMYHDLSCVGFYCCAPDTTMPSLHLPFIDDVDGGHLHLNLAIGAPGYADKSSAVSYMDNPVRIPSRAESKMFLSQAQARLREDIVPVIMHGASKVVPEMLERDGLCMLCGIIRKNDHTGCVTRVTRYDERVEHREATRAELLAAGDPISQRTPFQLLQLAMSCMLRDDEKHELMEVTDSDDWMNFVNACGLPDEDAVVQALEDLDKIARNEYWVPAFIEDFERGVMNFNRIINAVVLAAYIGHSSEDSLLKWIAVGCMAYRVPPPMHQGR